jgi:glutamyl/glutaminyl-tRNA synthetase
VSPSPGIFDEVKLNWVSAQHVRSGGTARYFEDALPYFPEDVRGFYPRERLKEIFTILSENLPSFSKIEEEIKPFRPGVPALDGEALETTAASREILEAAIAALGECGEWNAAAIAALIKGTGARLRIKGKALYMPLRAAVTGALHGPDLSRVMEIRGKESVLESIRAALGASKQP